MVKSDTSFSKRKGGGSPIQLLQEIVACFASSSATPFRSLGQYEKVAFTNYVAY